MPRCSFPEMVLPQHTYLEHKVLFVLMVIISVGTLTPVQGEEQQGRVELILEYLALSLSPVDRTSQVLMKFDVFIMAYLSFFQNNQPEPAKDYDTTVSTCLDCVNSSLTKIHFNSEKRKIILYPHASLCTLVINWLISKWFLSIYLYFTLIVEKFSLLVIFSY